MTYSGDLFILDNQWENITQEHKDAMHSSFLKSIEKKQTVFYELFSENILVFNPVLGANTFVALYKLGNNIYLFRKCIISKYLVYIDTPDVEFVCTCEEIPELDIYKCFKEVEEKLFQDLIDQKYREAQNQIASNDRRNAIWKKFMLGLLRAENENAFNEAVESMFPNLSNEEKEMIKQAITPIPVETIK